MNWLMILRSYGPLIGLFTFLLFMVGLSIAFFGAYVVTAKTAPVVMATNMLDAEVVYRGPENEVLAHPVLHVHFLASRKSDCLTLVNYYVTRDRAGKHVPRPIDFLRPAVNGVNDLTDEDAIDGLDVRFPLPDHLEPGEWYFAWRASDLCQFIPGFLRLQMRGGVPVKFTMAKRG